MKSLISEAKSVQNLYAANVLFQPKRLKEFAEKNGYKTLSFKKKSATETIVTGSRDEMKPFLVAFHGENTAVLRFPDLYEGDPGYSFDRSREYRRL